MNWSLIIPIFIIMILMPIVVTGTTSLLGLKAKSELVQKWGNKGQITVGALGVILHELGHALMAKLFGHKITGLRLIQFRHFKTNSTLGYVRHSWRVFNYYEDLGNFFIGIAPFFTCTGFLYLFHRLAIGTRYSFYVPKADIQDVDTVWYILNDCMINITNSLEDDFNHPLAFVIYGLLVLTVSLTGYGLSLADWGDTIKGLKYYLIFTILLTIIIFIASSLSTIVSIYVWKFTALMAFLMINSWLYVLFSIFVVMLIRYLINRHYRPTWRIPGFHWSNIQYMIHH